MPINITDELHAATTKGKIASAKEVFLTGDTENLQQIGEKTHQLEDSIKNIAATGGASTAAAVTFDNAASGMTAVNAQGAIEELSAQNKSQDTELSKKANSADVALQIQTEQRRVNAELEKKVDKDNNKAFNVTYDNSVSGIAAVNAQAAIDEVSAEMSVNEQNTLALIITNKYPVKDANIYIDKESVTVKKGNSMYSGFIIYLPPEETSFVTDNISGLIYAHGFRSKPIEGSNVESQITSQVNDNLIVWSINDNSMGMFILVTVNKTIASISNISVYMNASIYTKTIAENVKRLSIDINGIEKETLAISDVCGKYVDNKLSTVVTATSSYNGFLIKMSDIVYFTTGIPNDAVIYAHTFLENPTNGSKPIRTISLSELNQNKSVVPGDMEKYLLITIKVAGYTDNIVYRIGEDKGLKRTLDTLSANVTEIENIQDEIRDNICIYNTKLTPIDTDYGLIKDQENIFSKGEQSYPYKYAVFKVTAGESYGITGFSINNTYCCLKAGISNTTRTITLLTGTNKSFTNEQITVPDGYDLLLVNAKIAESYPIVKEKTKINEIVESHDERIGLAENSITTIKSAIAINKTTDGIKESGSELSQNTINLLCEQKRNLSCSNKSVPIVCLVYDDNYSQELVDMCNERGLKVTFAYIANIDKTEWSSTGNKLRAIQVNGHGTAAHGVVGGISVTGSGVNTMNDADNKKALEGENKAYDEFGLSHRGLVEFNSWADRPHTWAIIKRYYDYNIGFGEPVNIPGKTCLYELGRLNTDDAGMLDSAKAKIDEAISIGNCVVMFGGHWTRTGTGGKYSTREEIIALFDYIKEKIDAGLLVAMNTDDAIDTAWSRKTFIDKHNFAYENPCVGMLKIEDNTIKYCSNQGSRAIFKIVASGDVVASGSFALILQDSMGASQKITITPPSSSTTEDVIDLIVSNIFNSFTVTKVNSNSVFLYSDIAAPVASPSILDNTSGITFIVTEVKQGVAPVWI